MLKCACDGDCMPGFFLVDVILENMNNFLECDIFSAVKSGIFEKYNLDTEDILAVWNHFKVKTKLWGYS